MNSYSGLFPLANVLKDISAVGFHAIEISSAQASTLPLTFHPERLFDFSVGEGPGRRKPNCSVSIPDLGEALRNFGLTPKSMNASCELCHPKAVDLLRRRIEQARILGIPVLTTGVGQGWRQAGSRAVACDNLRMACVYASQFDITVGLKTDGWLTQGNAQAKEILETVQCLNLRIDFDPANLIYHNDTLDTSEYLLALADKIGCVHLRGTAGKAGDRSFPPIAPVAIDYGRIFEILNAAGFHGPFVLDLEDAYPWDPNPQLKPLTHAFWVHNIFDRETMDSNRARIVESLDFLRQITNIAI